MQRPLDFRMNYQSPLAKGLVFAGLGRHPRSNRYTDSSLFANVGALTNMTPVSDWVWVPQLGRWGLDFDGSNDFILFAPQALPAEFTVTWWGYDRAVSSAKVSVFAHNASTDYCLVYDATTMYIKINNTGAVVAHGVTISANTWSSFHVRRTAANVISLRVNCVPSNTMTRSGTLTLSTIGAYANASAPHEGIVADPMLHNRYLSDGELDDIADPSNVLLSGLIEPPRRKWWPVVAAGPSSALLLLRAGNKRGNKMGGTLIGKQS